MPQLGSGSVHLSLFGVVLDIFIEVKGAIFQDDSQIAGHGRPVGVGKLLEIQGRAEGWLFVKDVRHVRIISRILFLSSAGRGFATLYLIIAVVVLLYAMLKHKMAEEGGAHTRETRGAW